MSTSFVNGKQGNTHNNNFYEREYEIFDEFWL